MKKAHKFLSVFLALLMMISIIPMSIFTASAETTSGYCGGNLTWTFDDSTGTLTISGTGAMVDFQNDNNRWNNSMETIKNVVINEGATTIGKFAFQYCDNLESVTIPNTVTTIGDYAFRSCDSLESITIPDSVLTIGNEAFRYCESLANITIGDGITEIGYFAFLDTAYCNNESNLEGNAHYINNYLINISYESENFEIKPGTTVVADSAFSNYTKLKSVTIPDSVITLGENGFNWLDNLTTIEVDSNNQYYSSDEYGVLFNKDKTTLIQYPIGNTRTSYTIPDSVTTIADSAFQDCPNLTSVTIGNGVTTIGGHAFAYSPSLANITMGNNVATIGYAAFEECEALTSITMPDSVTTIEDYAFRECINLENVTFGNGIKTIGTGAFSDCTSLTSITIPDGIMTIGSSAFSSCENLENATIGDGITTIGDYGFFGCYNLKSVTIGDGIETIGWQAFYSCFNLESVTIGATTKAEFGFEAFENCSNLSEVNISDTSSWCNIKFLTETSNPLYYASILKLNGNAVTSIDFPDDLTEIHNFAFIFCRTLTNVTIPDGVTTIGERAFSGCVNITSLTIPDSVTTIGAGAFIGLTGLTSLTIPDNVTTIGNQAFALCDNLTSITIPDSLTAILPETFYGCSSLKTVTIPDSVTTIGAGAFAACSGLTSVIIPDSVTTIGNQAFAVCDSITDVYFLGTEEEWNNITVGEENSSLLNATIHFIDIYNMGEESYSFGNYIDDDSRGHCFGMAVTSAGYYLNHLDITAVGGNTEDDVYALQPNDEVKKDICYHQDVQGKFRVKSIVAGGGYYKTRQYSIESDWNEVVNYVKNHEHDNNGNLIVTFFLKTGSGHAVNFLRYENVDGQDRIYIYDNNFPNRETYLYKDSNGDIRQAPYPGTYTVPIDGYIYLVDANKYFELAASYDPTRSIYTSSVIIIIKGVKAEGYLMAGSENDEPYMMYEIPEDVTEVDIVPLEDNASFRYNGQEFGFGEVTENTVGKLVLSTGEEDETVQSDFTVTENSVNCTISIQTPSRTEIRNKDGIILHATVEGNAPDGYYVKWESNNGNFDEDADGSNLEIIAKDKGYTTFTAILCDADNKELARSSIEMYSKSGFFDKIFGFFRSIFRMTKIYEN